jgi:hypothetical protein
MFTELAPWRDLVRRQFQQLVPSPPRPGLDSVIVAHVRRGDFRSSGSSTRDLDMLHNGESSVRIPDEWYEHAFAYARRLAGNETPILLVSDAAAVELQRLTRIRGVLVASSTNPWEDLNSLIHARVRICSGSTFSDWAAYFADGPSIVVQGQNRLGDQGNLIEL